MFFWPWLDLQLLMWGFEMSPPGIRQKLQLHGRRQVNPQASRNTGILHQPCPQQPAGAITVTKGGCSTRPSPSICQGPTGSHGTGRGAKPFCHSLFSNDNHLIRPLLPRASERLLPQNIIGVHKSKPPWKHRGQSKRDGWTDDDTNDTRS